MGIVHPGSELIPSKAELLDVWLPRQPWWPQDAPVPAFQANFRLDDPAGEVGVETLLVRAGDGPVLQVPLTYRGAPLAGADEHLVGVVTVDDVLDALLPDDWREKRDEPREETADGTH